jgi:SAM-dependent methyltransferase
MNFAVKSASFFNSIAAGYDELLAADSWSRGAFYELVKERATPGSLVVDFGCGTGIDASWYASQGMDVVACDVSSGMLAQLEKRCEAEIARGQVTPFLGDYPSLLEMTLPRQARLVVSNFAVLSLIPDLRPTFAAFSNYLEPGGYVVVSILNPFYWKYLRGRWWWSSLLPSIKARCQRIQGLQHDTYRYFTSGVDAAAAPHFQRVGTAGVDIIIRPEEQRGDWSNPRTLRGKLEKSLWQAPVVRSLGQFMLLVYRKCE